MLDYTIQVEHWIQNTTREFEKLTAVFDVPLNTDNTAHFTERARVLQSLIEKYHDTEFIAELEKELKFAYQQPKNIERVNRYVGWVASLFEDFWRTAQRYEGRYSGNYEIKTKEADLSELLYEIRSFVKHETWDADPYNFDPEPTIESILSEYYDSSLDADNADSNQGDNQVARPKTSAVKLKWNCKPAVAGYMISELIRAGYIEPPTTNGELSYAKLAGICGQLFDIQSDGKPTTLDYLKKVVNPESNPLPDHKRAKLKLPDLDQLT